MKKQKQNTENETLSPEEAASNLESNDTPQADTDLALPPLRWFYARLHLTEADRKILFEKRGLTNATIDALGFRSNLESNKELLLELAKHFPIADLIESGLWKIDPKKPGELPKPNPQFYGMSIVEKRDAQGRKVRDLSGEAIRECVWNHPILIPYFNENSELNHIRPHKGMMAGKTPRYYAIRGNPMQTGRFDINSGPARQLAIITEGEFKAAAVWQAMGDMAEVGALPGITMAKLLIPEVEEWLELTSARQVVVGYDNENKADEALPGYQREKHRRFDAHIWARYLARQLSKQGYDGKVCVLPDAWRDARGKADWDGRLAMLVKKASLPDASPLSWDKIRNPVRTEFLSVVLAARSIGESRYVSFFDPETERIICNALDKISHEPCLPSGGPEEQVLAQRFYRMAAQMKQKDWFKAKAIGFLALLARSYQATLGRYYRMKALSEKQEEMWRELKEEARRRGDEDAKRVCDLVLRGRKSLKAPKRGHIPETVSDFYFRPLYVLHRTNGTRVRVVTIHTVHGLNTGPVEIPWEEFGAPVKLRDCVHRNTPGASWDGGQSELTALHEDFAHELSFKDVIEVPVRGYHAKSGIWFFEDVAITEDGEYFPDPKTKIFWIKRGKTLQGYCFARNADGQPRDREDDAFRQGVPHMHPDIKDTKESVTALFKDVLQKLPESVGQMEAYMALGMIFCSAAAPEIFKTWSCYPGLWVYGGQGEGKSALVRWLIRIWGFTKDKGLPLPADDQRTTLTLAALSGALGQYSNFPIWLDEYQATSPAWVRAILKNSYDRAEGAKKDFGASPREFLASVIVSGVATSSEPQTKSRFAHILISAKNRTANHYDWFQKNSLEFYRLGRFVLRHRRQFVESVTTAMSAWEKINSLKGVDDRARMVHGLAYAGFHAVCELFDSAGDWNAYRKWLIEHCQRSAADIKEHSITDLFWRELMNAHDAGVFGSRTEVQRFFQAIEEKMLRADLSPHQLKAGANESYKAWKSYLLYFKPGPVIELMRAAKRRSGGDLPFNQSDLLSQMKTRDYWHPAKHSSGHRQKFGGKSSSACWCIRVDLHELGYVRVTDEEFDQSLVQDSESSNVFAVENWTDPRKGDLFALIELLLSNRNEEGD